MDNKTSRIRCFLCGRLVPRYVIPEDLSIPSAIYTKKIGNKVGCICSACIQDGVYILANLQKKYMENSQVTEETETSVEKDGILEAEDAQDAEELDLMNQKYQSLNYSLDSIVKVASKHIFGQDEAIHKTVYAVFKNLVANMLSEGDGEERDHIHLFLIGNTGVGKTFVAESVAKAFGIPYVKIDCSALTAAGYVGGSVDDILWKLIQAAGQKVELAENGIVILDEFDKLKRSAEYGGKDISGLAVQQELLKFYDSSIRYVKVNASNNDSPVVKVIPFHTGKLTFIATGACVGLAEIIKKRLGFNTIGFKDASSPTYTVPDKEILQQATQEDMEEFGFIPELIGRTPHIIPLNSLTESIMMDILYQKFTENSAFFNIKGFRLYVDDFLIQKMASKLVHSKTGARDVKRMVEELLAPALYQVFQSEPEGICEINEDGSIQLLKHPKGKKQKSLELYEIPGKEEYSIQE